MLTISKIRSRCKMKTEMATLQLAKNDPQYILLQKSTGKLLKSFVSFIFRVASTSTTAATRSRCLQQRTVRRSLLQRSFPAQCVHGSLQNKAIWIGTWRGTLHPETSLINVTIVRTTARVKPLSNTTLRYVCSLYINFYFS